jgi:hypothetical protein
VAEFVGGGSNSVAVLGEGTPPLVYPVGIEGTITVLSASAVFTGTNPDGFLPALSFYDSDGNLISQAYGPLQSGSGTLQVSWFPGAYWIAVNLGFVDQVASMAPDIDLDKGCEIAFEVPDGSGGQTSGVTISDALLRVVTSGGVQFDVGSYMLVPGPDA